MENNSLHNTDHPGDDTTKKLDSKYRLVRHETDITARQVSIQLINII